MENSNRPQRPRIGKFDTPRRYTGDNFNKRKDDFSDSKNIVGDTNRRFERRSPRPTTGEWQSFGGNSRSMDRMEEIKSMKSEKTSHINVPIGSLAMVSFRFGSRRSLPRCLLVARR